MTDPHPVRWMRDVEVLLWTMSSGNRLWLGGRTEEGVGLRGFSWPRCTNGMGGGNHGLGRRLSEMWGRLRKYPHRFELGGSFGSGVSRACRVSGFRRRWEFSRVL
jgi:hypothetical protein